MKCNWNTVHPPVGMVFSNYGICCLFATFVLKVTMSVSNHRQFDCCEENPPMFTLPGPSMWRGFICHGSLIRYVKFMVAHAPGMPGTFSQPPRVSDPDMHHGTCVMHVPWCILGSITSGFLWSWWRGKHSRSMRNAQFTYLVRGPWQNRAFLFWSGMN